MNDIETSTKAVIYCRVSSKRQVTEGSGLDSQEHRCRKYAEAKGYEVEAIFPDDVSGGGDFMNRPGMVALLAYLDAKPDEKYIVIFDDLKRYARDAEFHLRLRRIMAERGATRECLNFNFEDSPEGRFFETIAAAQGELEREQNGRQVSQKMRARIEKGFYCFAPVPGYRYIDAEGGGRILVRDEPAASVIAEAFEGMASGRLQSTAEVQRYFTSTGAIRKNRHGEVTYFTVSEILRRPLYAGYISVPKWGVHLQPANHEPLVSLAVWKRVQQRLEGRAIGPARKDFNNDFPLRGFVCCAACDHPMTAAWTKGRNALYPYYVCYKRGCELKGKSVRKEKVEGDFETLLKSLKPAPAMLKLARNMFTNRWDQQSRHLRERAATAKSEIAALEAKIENLVERIMATGNERVVKAYEDQITSLDEQKALLAENTANAGKPRASFEDSFRTACIFLANPWKLWASDNLALKRTVLRLAFPGLIAYCRNEGFRTASIAEPLRLLGVFLPPDGRMVGTTGIEPVTPSMSTRCSPAELRAHPGRPRECRPKRSVVIANTSDLATPKAAPRHRPRMGQETGRKTDQATGRATG